MVQLLLASAGALLLYRLLVRLRPGAALQDAVVVITGASSGLGKGTPPSHFICSSKVCFCLAVKCIISNIIRGCTSCVVECARAFHAAGARLVLCGRDAARLQQVVQELTAASTSAKQQVCTLIFKKKIKKHLKETSFALELSF